LPGASHKRLAQPVFVAPRRFADQHHAAFGHAIGKDGVGGGAFQAAAVKGLKRRFEFRQARGSGRGSHGAPNSITGRRKCHRCAGGAERGAGAAIGCTETGDALTANLSTGASATASSAPASTSQLRIESVSFTTPS
jgi:hypothetical protein